VSSIPPAHKKSSAEVFNKFVVIKGKILSEKLFDFNRKSEVE